MPRISVDELEIPYSVAYRDIEYPRLEFKTGELLVVMPEGKEDVEEIIEKHAAWIRRKRLAISAAVARSEKRKLVERSVPELKKLVHALVDKIGREHDFQVGRTFFRKMNSKWASHSRNANLTINSTLRFLPSSLVEYVVFHEMAHSAEMKHNERF